MLCFLSLYNVLLLRWQHCRCSDFPPCLADAVEAEASTAEDVMEKAGGLAASAGHTVMRLFSAFMKGMHKKMEESRHHTPHETSRADRPRHARILKMPCPSTPKLSLLRSKHSLTNTTSWKLLLLA
ncbi:uncharacterized protein LOC142564553 isoform X3 [Dermacentor variabilis]|uniref:uncharacterized protein LOC142564553 isoform X3 n=1 Tax=Dermacentor variabilis TaxID=34621 RepID=UPI003F5B011D